jgi:hypothetical protein
MEISIAREALIKTRMALVRRQREVAEGRLTNPLLCLHAGPKMNYDNACKRFVVVHLERLFLRQERLSLSDSTTEREISVARSNLNRDRMSFHRRQNEVAAGRLSNPCLCLHAGPQMRYDEARQRFKEIHINLLLSSKKKRKFQIEEEFQVKEDFEIEEEFQVKEEELQVKEEFQIKKE